MKKILLAATMALTCMGAAHAQENPITIGFTGVIDYLPLFVAADEGFFEDQGLEVTLQRMPTGSSIPPGLLSDSLQIGGVAAPVAVQAKAGGFPMKVIFGVGVANEEHPNAWIVAHADSGIDEPADLSGKRIGIPAINSLFHVLLNEWLEIHDVDTDSITVVEVPFGQTADVLRSGRIDASAASQPHVNRIVSSGDGYVVAPYTGQIHSDLLVGVYAVTEDWISANPETPARFAAAMVQAIEFIENNHDQALASAATHLNLAPEILAEIPLPQFHAEVLPSQLQFWSDVSLRQGLIDEAVDPASLLQP